MWPLALLFHVYPHPITLLWVQDIAAVMTEVVAFRWISQAISQAGHRIPKGAGPLLAVGAVVVLVLNPWEYETIAFDFHFETITGFFTLLVAYDLWSGRTRRLWWWVALALVSSGLAAFFLIGVGISGILAGRPTRRTGALIGAVGAGWFIVFSELGGIGVGGKTFRASYGYLVGPHRGSIGPLNVVTGALSHPGAVVHMAASHWAVVLSFLVVLGVIGLFSPRGIGMALVVLGPNLLDGTGTFVRYGAGDAFHPDRFAHGPDSSARERRSGPESGRRLHGPVGGSSGRLRPGGPARSAPVLVVGFTGVGHRIGPDRASDPAQRRGRRVIARDGPIRATGFDLRLR